MNQPKVSVIIPTFNRVNYICEAIDSVLMQTYKDFEIIVVDDGSSDNTSRVLSKYKNEIKYFYQNNRGLSAARNTGVKQAKGDFIAFLDSDDIWLPEKLQSQIEIFIKYPEVGLVTSRAEVIDACGFSLGRYKPSDYSSSDLQGLVSSYFVVISSVLVKKKILDSLKYVFDETLNRAEDFDLSLRVAQISKIFYLDKVLMKYRITPGALSGNLTAGYEARIKILRKFKKNHHKKKEKFLIQKRLGKDYYCLAKENLKKEI